MITVHKGADFDHSSAAGLLYAQKELTKQTGAY